MRRILIFVCLFSGALIYCLLREEVIFTKLLNLFSFNVSTIQLPDNPVLDFIRYNLPDALWAIALMLTAKNFSGTLRAIALATPAILELLQLTPLIKGTFDIIDLVIYLIISTIFIILWKKEASSKTSLASA